MGSHAYGTQKETSDFDVVALVMNKHEHLFPQQYGFILDFDQIPTFQNKECKGEKSRIIHNKKQIEGEWNSLTRFFYLAAIKGSPNLLEILFVREHLIKFKSSLSGMLRDNRRLFLSMRSYHAIKGYCFSQFHRMRNEKLKGNAETKERQKLLDKFGYDTKKGYHVLRLLDLIEQMLTQNDLDLMKNKEECKAMRNCLWGIFDQLEIFVNEKLQKLDRLTENGNLASKPRSSELHSLLANMIEAWYGSESEMQKQNEYVSVKMMNDNLNMLNEKIDKIYNKLA
jgi:hypothetical protein